MGDCRGAASKVGEAGIRPEIFQKGFFIVLLSSHVFSSRVKVESQKFEFERVRVSALGKFSSSSQKSSQDFYSEFSKYSVKAEN